MQIHKHGRCYSLFQLNMVLTTLEALGEAPLWTRFFTMFRWPMNAAT